MFDCVDWDSIIFWTIEPRAGRFERDVAMFDDAVWIDWSSKFSVAIDPIWFSVSTSDLLVSVILLSVFDSCIYIANNMSENITQMPTNEKISVLKYLPTCQNSTKWLNWKYPHPLANVVHLQVECSTVHRNDRPAGMPSDEHG